MRRVTLLLVVLAVPCVFARAEVLENADLRLEVSSKTGSIIHLFDKRNQTEYITNQEQVRLFELLMPRTGNFTRRVNSWEQQVSGIEAKPHGLEIVFQSLRPDQYAYVFGVGMKEIAEAPLDIRVKVTLRLEQDHVVAGIHIDNRSSETISGVIFPFVGGLPQKSGDESARIVLPSLGQRVFHETSAPLSGERALRYPAVLATTWLNYELGSKGFGIEARSGLDAQDAFFALSSGPFLNGSAYRGRYDYPFIAWIFYPHTAGLTDWTSPDAVIHVHNSDWHIMAAEHREWFRSQNRPAPSKVWDQAVGFATFRLKRDDNAVDWKYEQIPQLADDAKTAGMRFVVIDGWREHEGPGNPAPYGEIADPRLGGATRLKDVVSKLADSGVELLFSFHPTLINVFYPTLIDAKTTNYPPANGSWNVKTRRGGNQIPVSFLYETADYPTELSNLRYMIEIDPASPATDYLLQEARRLKEEYGFRNLFLEGVGQRAFLSYSRDHSVAPQSVYEAGYRRFLGGLRELYPHGLLLTEGFNDLVNRFGDGAYTWSQTQDSSVLAFSAPWSHFSNDVEALDYEGANASFARKVLVNLIVDGGRSRVARYPDFVRHLHALQDLKMATAPYYADAEFRDLEGLTPANADPQTVISTFENVSSGQAGIVIANLENKPKALKFDLQLKGKSSTGRVYRISGERSELNFTPGTSLSLAAYEVVIIGIDPER